MTISFFCKQLSVPARVYLGGKWRMPTRWELWELWDYLNYGGGQIHYEIRNNMYGFRISAPGTGGSVFFPCAGRVENGSIEYFGTAGYYWTSELRPRYLLPWNITPGMTGR